MNLTGNGWREVVQLGLKKTRRFYTKVKNCWRILMFSLRPNTEKNQPLRGFRVVRALARGKRIGLIL
jgi:hypothetical protein